MFEFTVAFFGVLVFSLLLAPLSNKIGLIDQPTARKQHEGAIPLVGGLAIFSTIVIATALFIPVSQEMTYLLASCALLTMVGSLDDRYDVHYKIRLLVQALSAVFLALYGGCKLTEFGSLFGMGNIELGPTSLVITVVSVVGIVNAYNMIDGLDGLAGGLSLITTTALYFFIGDNIAPSAASILLLLVGALSAYLILNLHLLPKWFPKIFLGDAGSMVLGFILAAFLIRYSQGEKSNFHPVSALWLIAVPLMDLVATFLRRLKYKKSPFKADRGHVHHILMGMGYSPRKTLLIILSLQAVMVSLGIVFETYAVPEFLSFLSFLGFFILYMLVLNHLYKTYQTK